MDGHLYSFIHQKIILFNFKDIKNIYFSGKFVEFLIFGNILSYQTRFHYINQKFIYNGNNNYKKISILYKNHGKFIIKHPH